jgi:hypothetical protein
MSKKHPCKYKKCTRKGEYAFTRKDHLTEHLRNYHKQYIEKRGRREAADDDELEDDDEQDDQTYLQGDKSYFQNSMPPHNGGYYGQYQQ